MIRTSLVKATCSAVVAVALLGGCTQASPGTRATAAQPDSITADQLRTRIVAFADSLRAPSDSSAARVEAAFGVKLGPPKSPGFPNQTSGPLSIDDGTFYAVDVMPIEKGYSKIEMSFWTSTEEDLGRRETTTCVYDAKALQRDLEALGYQKRAERPFRGLVKWTLLRAANEGKDVYGVELVVYKTAGAEGKECVKGLQISGGSA